MTNFFHISIIRLSVDYTGNNRVGIDSSGLKILSVVPDGKLTSRFTKPLNWTVFYLKQNLQLLSIFTISND